MAQDKARRISFTATFKCASAADATKVATEAEYAFDGRVGKVTDVTKRGTTVTAKFIYGYALGGWDSDLHKVCIKIIEDAETSAAVEYDFERTKLQTMDREKFDEKRQAAEGRWPKPNPRRERE